MYSVDLRERAISLRADGATLPEIATALGVSLGTAWSWTPRCPRPSLEDRFWAKVDTSGECWLWRGATGGGYGIFRVGQRRPGAHRLAYELVRGPIPEGLTIDHLCRNRLCVRPDHLEAVTLAENVRRHHAAMK